MSLVAESESDGSTELVECRGNTEAGLCIDSQFVVSAAKVQHERVPGNDHLSGAVGPQPAHRSQPVLESAVIGLDRVVGIPLDMIQADGMSLSSRAGYTGAASVTTSL